MSKQIIRCRDAINAPVKKTCALIGPSWTVEELLDKIESKEVARIIQSRAELLLIEKNKR